MLTVLRHPVASPFTSGCRLATGRQAITLLIRRLQPACVFMPCYVPEGVIQPFQNAGIEIIFYKLQRDLNADLEDLESKMDRELGDRQLVIAIHYFGYSQPTELMSLAHKYNGVLLADRAHGLYNDLTQADVVLYSLNKMMPVTDGAIIVSRNPEIDLSMEHCRSLDPLPRPVLDSYRDHLRANASLSLAKAEKEASSYLFQSENSYDHYYDYIKTHFEPMAQSAESRVTETTFDLVFSATWRLINSDTLLTELDRKFIVRPEPAQFAFPIHCHGRREEIAAALFHDGVLAATLDSKWNHIPQSGYAVESKFIDDHLLLPIGDGVTAAELAIIAHRINQIGNHKVLQFSP
jgi:hypothetical protein